MAQDNQNQDIKSHLAGADLLGFRLRASSTRTAASKVGKPGNIPARAVNSKVGKSMAGTVPARAVSAKVGKPTG